jgi:oligoendopeptidase F
LNAPAKIIRTFLPEDFRFKAWDELRPFFAELDERRLVNIADTKLWLKQISELEAFVFEDMAWRYIRMSTDTQNDVRREAYHFFVREIQPAAAPYFDRFNRKLISAPGIEELAEDRAYAILLRNTQKAIDIYREENIDVEAKMAARAQDYGAIAGKMTIEFNGQEYTLPQSNVLLESDNRNQRAEVFGKIAERRLADSDALNELMSELVEMRHQLAENAEYANFRDYKFDELKRFDYTPADCLEFHQSVEQEVQPVIAELHEVRKKALGLDSLAPYDLTVDFRGSAPLTPFRTADELIEKGVEVLSRVHPFFGECLLEMQRKGHLDLESRNGKAPGGYNYPLYESGYPFIFMNAAGTQTDMMTFVHEAGHAVHSVLTQELELTGFKSCPSELAELASMSMELMTMDHWDVFYPNPEDLRRAKLGQLERALESLAWIAAIDCFQHWMYENPSHSWDDRSTAWRKIYTRFHKEMNWSGLETYRDHLWQKQLHLFEVPFYYIEYGMAQLGALAVWRNYKSDKAKGLQQYIDALSLGNARSIPEVYEAAGIRFDFSAGYIRELAEFVMGEINQLENVS